MSSAAPATNSRPSAPICPQRRQPTPLPPKPLPNQIPIDGQPLTSPRGFFLRRLSDAGPHHGGTGRRPAGIRTLHDTGPSSGADQLAEARSTRPSHSAVAGAVPNRTQNRSGRVLSPNPSTSRCKVCVVWEAVPRCEKQSFSANTIGDWNRWLHHCAPSAVSNRFGSLVPIGTRPDQQPKRKQASDHSQAAG